MRDFISILGCYKAPMFFSHFEGATFIGSIEQICLVVFSYLFYGAYK